MFKVICKSQLFIYLLVFLNVVNCFKFGNVFNNIKKLKLRKTNNYINKHTINTLYDNIKEELRIDLKNKESLISNDTSFFDPLITENLVDSLIYKKRSYQSIISERLFQNIDDYQINLKIKSLAKEGTSDSVNTKEKIVVLGTGWGSYSFLKSIDSTKFDVVVVSPRNYFMFTPMLAASAVGTVEFKSICDPIRNVNPFIDYLEASALSVNTETNTVTCQSIKCEGTSCEAVDFNVPYDYLIVAVGATTNTYGIKGVRDHCVFLKQIDDASNIRRAIVNCFERANVPELTEEEKRIMLSFVIVGAGPTGVEFTSELRDWVEVEGKKYYSKLLKYVRISLIEAGNYILPIFDQALREEALKSLTERDTSLIEAGLIDKEVTTVILKAGVKEINSDIIILSNGEKLPYGFCVWAAGNGPLPFVQDFVSEIPQQNELQNIGRGRIVTDNWCKAYGSNNIFSIGDCSVIRDNNLPATAQVASQQGAFLARLFSKNYNMKLPVNYPPVKLKSDRNEENSKFISEIIRIGSLGISPSDIFSNQSLASTISDIAKPFQFLNLGVLAYVGASKALAQIAVDDKNILSSGRIGYLLWRGVYWFKQVSWRNRILVGIDWIRSRLFGRDIGAF